MSEEQCSDSDELRCSAVYLCLCLGCDRPAPTTVSARVSMPVKSSNSPYSAAACPPSIPKSAWASMPLGCNAARPWNVCQPRLERTRGMRKSSAGETG